MLLGDTSIPVSYTHLETPRAFIAYSDDDKTVPPANGVNYYLGLHKNHCLLYTSRCV